MNGTPAGALAVVAVLALVLAAALSAGEAALLRLGRSGLAELALVDGARGRRTRHAARLQADPHGAVAAAAWVRVVLEAVGVVAGTTALLAAGLTWWQTVLVGGVAAGLVAVLGVRYVPRSLGRRHAVAAAGRTAGLLLVAHRLVRPVHRLAHVASPVPDRSEEELRQVVDRVDEYERIEEQDRELVRSVLELGDTRVRAVMVPRTEMITVPAATSVRKALSLFVRSGYSRVPVVGESVDDLVGVLYLKDLLRHRYSAEGVDGEPVGPLARRPVYVPESKPVDDLLREMQSTSSHIAMVVDEYGGVAGLVTIEDALEEIVGELTDEHDRSGPEVEDLGDGAYRVPSRLPVHELGELFDIELDDDDVDTAGGLLAKALGKVPLAGSSADVAGLRLTADRVEGRRRQVATLLVSRAGEPSHPPHEGAHR